MNGFLRVLSGIICFVALLSVLGVIIFGINDDLPSSLVAIFFMSVVLYVFLPVALNGRPTRLVRYLLDVSSF